MRPLLLLVATLLVTGNWVFADEEPNLDDLKTPNKILGGALTLEDVQHRETRGGELVYAPNSQIPYTGWVKSMWDNGQVRQLAHYKDGKLGGVVTVWHKNGQKKVEGHFKDGKGEGLYTVWDENGRKRSKGHYKDGKQDGLWREWDKDGKVVKQTRYKDGVEVEE